MNGLMYCISSVSGGALEYLRNIAPRLEKRFSRGGEGHSFKFLAHEEQEPLFRGIEESRIRWIRGARPLGYRRVWWERRNLTRILDEEKIDVLFNPYQIGIPTPGRRQVMMARNMEPFLFREYRYDLRNWLRNHLVRRSSLHSLRHADRVIAISMSVRDHLVREVGIDPERVRLIYHGGSNLNAGNREAADRELIGRIGVHGDFLLTPGTLLPYRRCEDVIAAFGKCASALGDGMRLVIAGAGTDRRYGDVIRRAIAASPVRERILTVGHVPWETMAALYRLCRACVIATEIEACPNIAIEAMAAGCVIVSGDRPPLPEMFSGCALEYRARDLGQLAQQMRRAVEDVPLRQELRAKSLRRAKDFSWETCANQTFAALTEW